MDSATIENALEKKCQNHFWLLSMFLITASPGIFNSMHLTSYVFLSGDPSFFCDVPELRSANWTEEQIKIISSPGNEKHSCGFYAWNYTFLDELGFEKAITYCNNSKKPNLIKCNSYIYNEKARHQTIVSQWDLVCESLHLRSMAQVGAAVGKFFGAFFFGLLGDRYGRKKIFLISCFMYITSAPTAAFVNSYMIFIILRFFIGVSAAGVSEAGCTILFELTVKNYRSNVGSLFFSSYSVGLMFLSLAAYFTENWRHLQLAISLPTILLLINCWYLPESPRWLMTRGKLREASKIIGIACPQGYEKITTQKQSHCCNKKVILFMTNFFLLFSTFEITKRTLISFYGWSVTNLCYYVIALNGTNFRVNQYLYIALNGAVEVPGYLLPSLVLRYYGRKSSGLTFFTISGIALFSIMIIPQGWPIICMALIGRLAICGVIAIIVLHTSELFPTEQRSTAIGSSLTVAQLAIMASPYVVDLLGELCWWIPTTLCGCLALIGGFLLLFLPETKDALFMDTLSEMNKAI